MLGSAYRTRTEANYILFEMLVNVEVSLPLMAGITATRARPVAAAIRPYSIAVAPDSSLKNFFIINSNFYLQHLLTY